SRFGAAARAGRQLAVRCRLPDRLEGEVGGGETASARKAGATDARNPTADRGGLERPATGPRSGTGTPRRQRSHGRGALRLGREVAARGGPMSGLAGGDAHHATDASAAAPGAAADAARRRLVVRSAGVDSRTTCRFGGGAG